MVVSAGVEGQLRDAAWASRLREGAYGPDTVKVWMPTMDPAFGGRWPAWALRHGDVDARRRVIVSAERFVVE